MDVQELEKFHRLRRVGNFALTAFSVILIVACTASFWLFQKQSPRLVYTIFGPVILFFALLSIAWNAYLRMRWSKILKASSQSSSRPVRCEIYGIENPHYTGDVYILPRQGVNGPSAQVEEPPPPYHQVVPCVHSASNHGQLVEIPLPKDGSHT